MAHLKDLSILEIYTTNISFGETVNGFQDCNIKKKKQDSVKKI